MITRTTIAVIKVCNSASFCCSRSRKGDIYRESRSRKGNIYRKSSVPSRKTLIVCQPINETIINSTCCNAKVSNSNINTYANRTYDNVPEQRMEKRNESCLLKF